MEAFSLGLGDPITVSAAHGIGMDELYARLIPYFPQEDVGIPDEGDGQILERGRA